MSMNPSAVLADHPGLRRATNVSPLVRDASLVALGVLATAVLAQVRIPLGFTPVPLTGQTFAVLLVGTVLGATRGATSQAAYVVLGASGVPIFAGGEGGWSAATGATMGYLVGFVVAAWVVGRLAERRHDRRFVTSLLAMVVGSAVVYALGASWLAVYLGVPLVGGSGSALALGVVPFLAGDAIKAIVAAGATASLWRLVGRD